MILDKNYGEFCIYILFKVRIFCVKIIKILCNMLYMVIFGCRMFIVEWILVNMNLDFL